MHSCGAPPVREARRVAVLAFRAGAERARLCLRGGAADEERKAEPLAGPPPHEQVGPGSRGGCAAGAGAARAREMYTGQSTEAASKARPTKPHGSEPARGARRPRSRTPARSKHDMTSLVMANA